MIEAYKVAKDVYLIDVEMWTRRYSSVYIVAGDSVVLVETGLSTSADKILEGIAQLGFHKDEITHIIVTHIHLDHAGGAGILAKEFRNTEVVVHKKGVPHIIDTTKLVKSAKRALGEMGKAYGLEKVVPVSANKVKSVDEGDIIDIGSRHLKVLFTPGHSSHHICLYDEENRGLFTGDAVGIYYPDVDLIKPTTPPPNFDMDVAISSIQRLQQLNARALFFSHFGMVKEKDVERILNKGIEGLQAWGKMIREALSSNESFEKIASKLASELNTDLPFLPTWQNEQFAPVMVAGYMDYFKRKGEF